MRPDQSFDAYAVAYDRFCESIHHPLLPELAALGVGTAGRRAVDLGCGSGRTALELASTFDEVVGVDLSEPLLALARRNADDAGRTNVSFVPHDLATFRSGGPGSEGFDLVFSSTALHHVEDLDAALASIRDLAAPGGWVVLRDVTRLADPRLRWIWRHGGFVLGPLGDLRRALLVERKPPRQALQTLRFQLSPAWVRHLLADRWLTYDEFVERYTAAFPGGRIERLHGLPTLVWQKPH